MNWGSLLDDIGIAALLPVDHAHFSKPICDALAVFLDGLPAARQAELFATQATLSPSADVAERLGLLARSCPVLQKIGQVLARDQRLSPTLRWHLQQLESLPPSVPWHTIETILDQEFGDLDRLGVTLTPPAIAEASVAVVVPFRMKHQGVQSHGVFKILKPGIEEVLEQELGLLKQVGAYLDERCDELQIPHLDYQEAFQQVHDKLSEETCLAHEQQHIAAAHRFYEKEKRVQIPMLLEFCTPRVTAMERIWGDKVTNHCFKRPCDRRRLAKMIVDAMVAQPVFSRQNPGMFHSDPHAGNLFLTTEGRLGILDWSLVGWLEKSERSALVQIMLAAIMQDERQMRMVMSQLAVQGKLDPAKLRHVIKKNLKNLRQGHFSGLVWLVGMIDEAVHDAGLRLPPNLMLFRKSLYTLEGVVNEIDASTTLFDQVLSRQFLLHFLIEWPTRWAAMPNSREFATRLSNYDLAKTLLSLPSSTVRFWLGLGSDCWDVCLKRRALPSGKRRADSPVVISQSH